MPSRLTLARVLGVISVALYNWWIVVPFLGGWLSSPDGFFSDLSADGQPHAGILRSLDLAAALVLVVALGVRGRHGRRGPRPEWGWLLAFAVAGMVGARFAYGCAEGLDSACRSAERQLDLPAHHYIHMAAGVTEFATVTVAIWLAGRRYGDPHDPEGRLARVLARVLIIAYPLLGIAYLSDRLGSLIEPVFFVSFSAMVLIEVFEPERCVKGAAAPRWSRYRWLRSRSPAAAGGLAPRTCPGRPRG